MPNEPPQRVGTPHQQVGRFQIISHIASGGMGAVYKARDPETGELVAIKVLSAEKAVKETLIRRFKREATAARKLDHDNIVRLVDSGEVAGSLYLALEYVEGTDLLDYLEQQPGGRLDVEPAVEILRQACRALDHLHSKGIIHRDIKPSNFLVTTKDGHLHVKLADLGLAREEQDDRITSDNTTLGTVDYIAPEQARDSGAADVRSDIYSLGCSFFHMLTGHSPFPKGTLVEKIQHHLFTPAPDVRDFRSDIPDLVAAILNRMLAKHADQRYPSPLYLLQDLETPEAFEEYLKRTEGLDRPPLPTPSADRPTLARTEHFDKFASGETLIPDDIELLASKPELPAAAAPPLPASNLAPGITSPTPAALPPLGLGGPRVHVIPSRTLTIPARPSTPVAATDSASDAEVSDVVLEPLEEGDSPADPWQGEDSTPRHDIESDAVSPEEGVQKAAPRRNGRTREHEVKAGPSPVVKSAPKPVPKPTPPERTSAAEKLPAAERTNRPGPTSDKPRRDAIATTPSRKPAPTKKNVAQATREPARQRLRRQQVRRLWQQPLVVGGVVGGLFFASFVVWAMMMFFSGPAVDPGPIAVVPPEIKDDPPPVKPKVDPKIEPKVDPKVIDPKVVDPPEVKNVDPPLKVDPGPVGPEVVSLASMFKTEAKLDVAKLEREIRGPHPEVPATGPVIPAGALVLQVDRGSAATETRFPTLAQAWKRAGQSNRPVVIEIREPNPLHIGSLDKIAGVNVILRGAEGMRPILMWDPGPSDPAAWFDVDLANVTLHGIDFIVDATPKEEACCFQLRRSNLTAHDCTLWQRDGAAASLSMVRVRGRNMMGSEPSIRPDDQPLRVHLNRCYLEGTSLEASHIDAPAVDFLFEQSLHAGLKAPSVRILGRDTDATSVRWLRSTVVGGRASLSYTPGPGQGIAARVALFGLDSLLARHGAVESDAAMIYLDPQVGTTGLQGRFVNCVYAGWPLLLKAGTTRLTDLTEWRRQWGHRDGDIQLESPFPPQYLDRLNPHPVQFAPRGTAAAFAALTSANPVGAPAERLASMPSAWGLRPTTSWPNVTLDLPDGLIPAIPAAGDGLYHGEILDLAKVADLGKYLADKPLAPRVVLQLLGKGTYSSSPIRLRGSHLVVYAPPGGALTLEFKTENSEIGSTLVDIEDGNLELINLRIRLDWKKMAVCPKDLLRVQGGKLSMTRCVVQTPLKGTPAAFQSLIALDERPEGPPTQLACRDSILVSSNGVIRYQGQAGQIRCRHNLMIAQGDLATLQLFGEVRTPAAALFEYNTFGLEKAFLAFPFTSTTNDGPTLVVHARANHFTSFGATGPGFLLRVPGDGIRSLVWLGVNNVFDVASLGHYLVWGQEEPAEQTPRIWIDFWGASAEKDLIAFRPTTPAKALNPDPLNLDRFVLPSTLRLDLPGANMPQLISLYGGAKKK